MPYTNNQRVKRNSMVDQLTKVPVHRGSLLKGIENLLKTIESSESAVMIPTLLRDKCEFDAWELLFVAKILKASILGHIDLVEFYMNHIGLSSSQFSQSQSQNGTPTEQQKPATPTNMPPGESLSPTVGSTTTTTTSAFSQEPSSLPNITSSSLSSSSLTSSSSTSTATANGFNNGGSSSSNGKSSTTSWTSAASSQPTSSSSSETAAFDSSNESSADSMLAAANRAQVPLNQRPSLLQLTTTNNHINSVAAVAAGLTNNSPTVNADHLTNQAPTTQQPVSPKDLAAHLSISTGINQPLGSLNSSNGNGHLSSPSRHPSELRPSKSAGCLFRMNSGASSPRTPTTPGVYPQAETLANGNPDGSFPGDPSAPVKLLLQIEQLKSSIGHVTSLLESVVELYKQSIDTLA